MRHDVGEMDRFPATGAIPVSVELVRRLSPDSLSVMEFKSDTDVVIAEKMLRFPLLGQKLAGTWNLSLTQEFNMTTDSHLFKTEPGPGRLPLYEGKMIHQFTHTWAQPRYWLDEAEASGELRSARMRTIKKLGKDAKLDVHVDPAAIKLDYTAYRLAFRDVTASTNERAMIMTVLPRNVFCPHTMSLEAVYFDVMHDAVIKLNQTSLSPAQRLFVTGLLNSFVLDHPIRQRITNHLSFFFIYNLPVPRLTERDPEFAPIVERAARLVCTTPEFDDLAREAGLGSHAAGATDPVERGRLRAELDGLVAHLYGLAEAEFAHILGTFPLVPEPVRVAARNAYRDVERGLVK
jgi:hypothetical protein